MGRLLLGVLCDLVSMATIILFLLGPDQPPVGQILAALYCDPGEQVIRVGLQTINFSCVSVTGEQRSINAQVILTGIAAFGVSFIAGLGLSFSGIAALKRQQSASAVLSGTSLPVHVNPPVPEQLVSKLQQLQQAVDKGLITRGEYDRSKRDLLNRLGKDH